MTSSSRNRFTSRWKAMVALRSSCWYEESGEDEAGEPFARRAEGGDDDAGFGDAPVHVGARGPRPACGPWT